MERPMTMGVKGILVLFAGALAACGNPAAASPQAKTEPRQFALAEGAQPVRVAEPRPTQYRSRVVVSGDLRPDQSAQLGFAVGGTLERIAVSRGERVQAGQTLAVLDAALARAGLAQAKAGVEAAEAQQKMAADGLARAKAVHQHEGVSEAQLLQAESQHDLARAQLAAARAQLAQVEVQLRYHTLKAPFAGLVTQVPPGPGMTVGPGVPLFGLESTGSLVLDATVSPAEAAGLAVGTRVRVTCPDSGIETDEAVVRAVVGSAIPMGHRVPVEIDVPNPAGRFLAHTLARVEIETGEKPALRLPASALFQRDGAFSVWTLGPDDRAQRVSIRLITSEGDQSLVEPEKALSRAQVVDQPPVHLTEGAKLAVIGGAR